MTMNALDEYGSYILASAAFMIPASPLRAEDDAINHLMVLSQRGAKQSATLIPPASSGTARRTAEHKSPTQASSAQKPAAPRGVSLLPDSLLRMLPPAGRAAEARPSSPAAAQTEKPPPAPCKSAALKRQAASVDGILRRVRACHRMPSAHLAETRRADEQAHASRAKPAQSEQRMQRPDAAALRGAPRTSAKPPLRPGASAAKTASDPLLMRAELLRETGADDSGANASASARSPHRQVSGSSITTSARLAAKLATLFGPDITEEFPQASTPKRKKQHAGASDAGCQPPRGDALRPQRAVSPQAPAVELSPKWRQEAAIPSGLSLAPDAVVDSSAAAATEGRTAASAPDRSPAAAPPAASFPRAHTRTDQQQACDEKRSHGGPRASSNASTPALAPAAQDSTAKANLGAGSHSADRVQSTSIVPSAAAASAAQLDVRSDHGCGGCDDIRGRTDVLDPGGRGAVCDPGRDACAGEQIAASLDCSVQEGCRTDGGSTVGPSSIATTPPDSAENGNAVALASHACVAVGGGRASLLELLRARREAATLLIRTQLDLERLLQSQQPLVRIDCARLREVGRLVQQHLAECAGVESRLAERSPTPPRATPPDRVKQRPFSATSFPSQPTTRLPALCSEAAAAGSAARNALASRLDVVDAKHVDAAPATTDDTTAAKIAMARDSTATSMTLADAGAASASVTRVATAPAGADSPLATAVLRAPDAAAVTTDRSSRRQASSVGRVSAAAATATEETNAVPAEGHERSSVTGAASAPALPRTKSCLPSAAPSDQAQIEPPHQASASTCIQKLPPQTAAGATKRRQLQPRTGSRTASAVATMPLMRFGRAPLAILDASEAECSSRFSRSQPTDAKQARGTKRAIEKSEASHDADKTVRRILQLVHGHHREARSHLIQVRMSPTMGAIETE